MPKPISSHYRDGVQYYWTYPSTNKQGQRAFRFIERLLLMDVPKDKIETSSLEDSLSPKVYVFGKEYQQFGEKTLAKIKMNMGGKKKLVKV